MVTGHTSELTWIKRGALSVIACTDFPEHPSSPSISNRPTCQHSVCPRICSPSPRCLLQSFTVFLTDSTTVSPKGIQISVQEMRLEWHVAAELPRFSYEVIRSSTNPWIWRLLHFIKSQSQHAERHSRLLSRHRWQRHQIEALYRAYICGPMNTPVLFFSVFRLGNFSHKNKIAGPFLQENVHEVEFNKQRSKQHCIRICKTLIS